MTDTACPSTLKYTLVFPAGWTSLDLQSPRLHQEVDLLIQRQLANFGSAPNLRREILGLIRGQADAARHIGGVELHLSLMPAGAFTIPACLLVSVSPPGAPVNDLSTLKEALHSQDPDKRLEVVVLSVGETLRSRDRRSFPADLRPPTQMVEFPHMEGGEFAVSFGTTYYLPIPGYAGFLTLSFSSPLIALADPLTDLFDSIASTFRWTR